MTSRSEVLQHLEGFLKSNMSSFLRSVEESWQPADFLPDSRLDSFFDQVKELREKAKT
jgi:acyl-[acyl-carrier-protein] desaturase